MDFAPTAAGVPTAREVAPSLDELVEREVFDMVVRGLPEGFGTGVVPLTVAAVLLHILAAPPYLSHWVAAVAIILLIGVAFGIYYRRHLPSPAQTPAWRAAMYVLVGTSGLSWGMAGWLFVPAPWQAEMVVLTLLVSLAAAVLANIGASLSHYLVFVTGAMLPTAVYRAMLGGAMNVGFVIGAVMMMIVLAVFAARLAAATRRSLRVGHENKRLARALEQRTRALEQVSLDKSRFIAAASHDLRQPVHALGLLLDVLQGQALSPQARGTAERMSKVLESLESLFGALLDIARLDSGAIEPRREVFSLQPLLDTLAAEFCTETQAKGLALRFRDTSAWICSDPVLLERILRNLIANAVRYTTRGGVLVGCRRRGALLRIEVWDSGIGIATDQQAAIFDEFYQIANRARDAEQGLGLGLAIVRRLASLLVHRVELASRVGRGSAFFVSVPIADARAPIPAKLPTAVDQPAPAATPSARQVLVVDDDARAREALGTWLAAWGCDVVSCASAADVEVALESLPHAPDALITDWRLPGGEDGLDVVRRVRERFGADVPAILITGDALDDARRVAAAHAVLLLHKPVRPAALRASLNAQWLPVPPTPVPSAYSSTAPRLDAQHAPALTSLP